MNNAAIDDAQQPEMQPLQFDADQFGNLLDACENYIRLRWRGGRGTDHIDEPLSVATSTMRTVLRRMTEGDIDPNDPDLVAIVLDNARRKLDTAQHQYRRARAKREVTASALGETFRPEEIFDRGVPVSGGGDDVIPYVNDEDLDTAFDDAQERRFAEQFMRWCDDFESGLAEADKQVWYQWKLGFSIEETAKKIGLTEYKVKKARSRIVASLKD